jgi:hypothetical protein
LIIHVVISLVFVIGAAARSTSGWLTVPDSYIQNSTNQAECLRHWDFPQPSDEISGVFESAGKTG